MEENTTLTLVTAASAASALALRGALTPLGEKFKANGNKMPK